VGVVGFVTLLCVSTVPKEVRIDLAWSCFDASNCPCKAVRSGSRSYESSVYVTFRRQNLFPWNAIKVCGSVAHCCIRWSYRNFLSARIYLLRTIIFLLMIYHAFYWSIFYCVQISRFAKLCLFYILRHLLCMRT
jgi:hypothetical protein